MLGEAGACSHDALPAAWIATAPQFWRPALPRSRRYNFPSLQLLDLSLPPYVLTGQQMLQDLSCGSSTLGSGPAHLKLRDRRQLMPTKAHVPKKKLRALFLSSERRRFTHPVQLGPRFLSPSFVLTVSGAR